MAAKNDNNGFPATNDAYTGMLAISLFALIGGCVLLYLDYSQYPDSKAPTVPKAPSLVKKDDAAAPAKQVPPKVEPAPEKALKVDAPPKVEPAPKAEPAKDAPKVDAPKVDAPKDAPKVDAPPEKK